MGIEEFVAIPLSEPTAERIEERGYELAGLIVFKFRDGLYRSPFIVGPRTMAEYYQAVALAQCAILEIVTSETSQEWNTSNIQASIPPYWGKHPDKKVNKKLEKQWNPGGGLIGTQKSILNKGLGDLIHNRILRVSVGELELDPLAADFDPLSGEAVDKLY